VRTAVISDLHLGKRSGIDLLRRPEVRERLFEGIAGIDQLVLLGDVLELRDLPVADVLELSRPFFDELGEAVAGARVVLVAGNHDHQIAAEWLDRRRQDRAASPLGLEQVTRPAGGSLVARLAERLNGCELVLAHPGSWIRPDVYATHGHYLDCHNAVPSLEAIAAGASARVTRSLPPGPLGPDAYESVLAPLYALAYGFAQAERPAREAPAGGLSVRVWERLNRSDRRFDPLRLLIGRVAIPGLVATLNAAGLGHFDADLSGRALRRAALAAMAEVVERLEIDARYVIFGHTHRSGPLPGDDEGEWVLPGDGCLLNSGSWVHEPPLIGADGTSSPYWPGKCVFVEDDEPPRLERLLERLP